MRGGIIFLAAPLPFLVGGFPGPGASAETDPFFLPLLGGVALWVRPGPLLGSVETSVGVDCWVADAALFFRLPPLGLVMLGSWTLQSCIA